MANGPTTDKTAVNFVSTSTRVSPSTKTPKQPSPTFGPHSQFAGIGRGVAGDPRK